MESKDSLLFNFGDWTPDDVQRALAEFRERSYTPLDIDETMRTVGSDVARSFLQFVRTALKGLGLLTRAGIPNARAAVLVEPPETTTPTPVIRALWNERASDWAVIESATVYAITIETLLEHLRGNPTRKELFLSLGSGPGLYETFLGALWRVLPAARQSVIYCVDVAERMTEKHREILRHTRASDGSPLANVCPLTGDMQRLDFYDGTFDQILCNNALQWVPEWQAAVAEMARVMNPQGLGWLYLFVHAHPMVVFSEAGEELLRLPHVPLPTLLDVLEAHRFAIHHIRQIAGAPGTGQMGATINRVFVKAKFAPAGVLTPWREHAISSAVSFIGKTERPENHR